MAIMIKTSSNVELETLNLSETIYGDAHFSEGTLVYIWTSEKTNGDGLACRGIVERVMTSADKPRLEIRRVGGAPQRPLTKEMLAAHRDGTSGTPIAGLAKKLYRHALNKITELTADEAAFADSFFERSRDNSR